MASSLFPVKNNPQQNNKIQNALSMLQGIKNPAQMAQNMMAKNPQFKSFVEQNQGKSVDQIASENGIDLSQFKSLLGR